jgi:hypothetical protein
MRAGGSILPSVALLPFVCLLGAPKGYDTLSESQLIFLHHSERGGNC